MSLLIANRFHVQPNPYQAGWIVTDTKPHRGARVREWITAPLSIVKKAMTIAAAEDCGLTEATWHAEERGKIFNRKRWRRTQELHRRRQYELYSNY